MALAEISSSQIGGDAGGKGVEYSGDLDPSSKLIGDVSSMRFPGLKRETGDTGFMSAFAAGAPGLQSPC